MSHTAALTFVETASMDELAPHAAAWDALAVAHARHGGLTATYPWFSSFAEHRLAEFGRSWGCLLAYEEDALVGVLPFARRPHALLRGARPWLHVPGDEYTTGGGLLVEGSDPERAQELARALVRGALALAPRAIGIRFGGLVPDAVARTALAPLPGALVAEEDLAGRSVPLDGTWADFHAGLGSNLRRNLRKARNRLAKEGALEVESSANPADLDRFLTLESSGWKGADGGAVANRPDALGFYRAFVERLAERGWLQWHFLTLDGTPIAGSLAACWGRQIVLQRVAFDEAHARTSPGQLLLASSLEAWFDEQRYDRMDCLTDQPWHATWCMERTPYAALTLAAPGPIGQLAGGLPARARERLKGFGLLRRIVRRVRGEAPQ